MQPNESDLPTVIRLPWNEVCLRFRNAWQQATALPPEVEDYLPLVSDEQRANCFGELLQIDIEQRLLRGEAPQASFYYEKFPQYAKGIEDCFRKTILSEQRTPDQSGLADSMQTNEFDHLPSTHVPTDWRDSDSDTPSALVSDPERFEIRNPVAQGGLGVVFWLMTASLIERSL